MKGNGERSTNVTNVISIYLKVSMETSQTFEAFCKSCRTDDSQEK